MRVKDRRTTCWVCMAFEEYTTDPWKRGELYIAASKDCTCKPVENTIPLLHSCAICGEPCKTKHCLECSSARQVQARKQPKCEGCGTLLHHELAKRCTPCRRIANADYQREYARNFTRGNCQECGTSISAGATHCRVHSRAFREKQKAAYSGVIERARSGVEAVRAELASEVG